jgi:hypothetical protein
MPLDQGVLAIGYLKKTGAKEPDARVLNRKNKTSSIRGGTRSGSQSSWWKNDIRLLTLHQLIFSGF